MQVVYDLNTTDFTIPALCAQVLVENAVQHGIHRCSGEGRLVICSQESPEAYLVSVKNNGPAFDPERKRTSSGTPEANDAHRSIGLSNVASRLRLQCNGTLHIEGGADGTTATITIPKGDQ